MRLLLLGLWIVLLLVPSGAQRTPAPNSAVASISPDGIPITPLVSGQTERVPPCGYRVFAFDPRASTSQYHLEILFTSRTNVKFETALLAEAPGKVSTTVQDTCYVASHRCNTTAAAQTCSLIEACGGVANWFIVVKTSALVEGFFSLDAFVASLPPAEPLTIDPDEDSVMTWREVTSVGKDINRDPINKYDFFQFDIDSDGDPDGTVLHIQIVPTNPGSGILQSYLNFGEKLAFPSYDCHNFPQGTTLIPACEYAQGGRWHLTIIRTVMNQEYKVRLWKEVPTILDLEENKRFYQLRRRDDEVFFKWEGLQDFDEVEAFRFFAIVDNIVGGSLIMAVQYDDLPWLECSELTQKSCSSLEGCHVAYDPCEVRDKTEGAWYIGVRALVVDNQHEPLTFTVSALAREIRTFDATPNEPIVGQLLQGQQAHYLMPVPFDPSGNWIDYNVYVDRRYSDLPATMYLGTKPFPGPSADGCTTFTKACTANTVIGNIKSCFLQLDPCELAAYPDGVYISVIATSPNSGPQQNFWYQDTTGFTVSSELWNPNEEPQALTVGQVITEVVSDTEYNIFRIIDFTGVLRLTVSGNLHNVINPTPQQRARQEVAVSIVYGSRVEGPSCGKCWTLEQTRIVRATETLSWDVATCHSGSEGVFVVVRGLSNTNLEFRQNEFVLSTSALLDSSTGDSTRDIDESVHSSTFATTGIYGQTEHWILNFDRRDLTHKALSLQLRAHPRSGRRMQLSAFTGEVDFGCGSNLPGETCAVDNTNKGFCTLTFQACYFDGDTDDRTFLVIISADTSVAAVGNTTIDRSYDFRFDVLDQDPQFFELGQPYATEVRQTVYTHLALQIPDSAVGTENLVIEAYFDVGHQESRNNRSLSLYGNSPSHGDFLAGRPTHGCYCNSFSATDIEKVVHIIDRCSIQGGIYHLSLFTDGLTYDELGARVTINAYLMPFVIPLNYEFPIDYRLYFGQSTIFQIEVDERMVNSYNRTDKELTITTNVNLARHNATIDFTLHSVLADCFCETLGDRGWGCAYRDAPNRGQCRLQRDYCQLRPPGHYYIRTSVLPRPGFDRRQPVPFTILASKANLHPLIQSLTVTDGCAFSTRRDFQITTFVESTELQFFKLEDFGFNSGERLLEVYVSNVTDGDVQVNIGNDFLPTTNCNAANKICKNSPSGPECITQAVCAEKATHVSVKATSTNTNEPVKFRISACLAELATLSFGNAVPEQTTLAPGASRAFSFEMDDELDADRTPTIVARVNADRPLLPGERYTISLTRGACGACQEFGRSQICQSQNCSLILFFCELPMDYAETKWTLQIDSSRSAEATYFYNIFGVPVPPAEPIDAVTGITRSIPNLQWVRFAWTLLPNQVFTPVQGIQRTYIDIRSLDANGAGVESFSLRRESFLSGRCPTRIAASHQQLRTVRYTVSDCCTQSGTAEVLLFNHDFINSASFQITPTIDNLAVTTRLEWDFVSNSASSSSIDVAPTFNAVRGPISEALALYPGSPSQPYSSLMVQIHHLNWQASKNAANVRAYVREDGIAGPSDDCFSFDAVPPFVQGQAVYNRFACDPIRPHDLFVGVENLNDVPERFNVTYRTIFPIALVADSFSNFVTGYFNVNQQFYIDLPLVSGHNDIQLDVEIPNGSVEVFYAMNRPGGVNSPGVTCTRGTAPDAQGQRLDAPRTWTRTIPSCSLGTGRLYIGVKTRTYDFTTYRVKFSFLNNLPTRTVTPITWGTPIRNQTLATTSLYSGFIGTGLLTGLTYVRFSMEDFTGGAAASQYRINVYRDGTCGSTTNSFCSLALGLQKCSTIIPSCELRENANYYFQIVQVGGSAQQFTVRPELLTLNPTFLSLPNTSDPLIYAHSINSHDIHLFVFDLPIRSLLPGENVTVKMDSEVCGDIVVSGNRGDSAGPRCGKSLECTDVGCTIIDFEQCDLLNRGDNHRTDFWIFVRGRNQTQDAPIQYSFIIERRGGYRMQHIYSNELHYVYAKAKPRSIASTCANGRPAQLPSPCCGFGANKFLYDWETERTVFVYPIEGALLIGLGHQFRLTVDQRFGVDARLSVWNHQPHFCNSAPRLADRSGFFQSCVASAINDRTCVITLNQSTGLCRLAESHQLFVAVEYVNLTAAQLPDDDPTDIPVASVRHSVLPHEIVGVQFSEEPQWYRFALVRNEVLYFKVYHAENRTETDNYHFRATILDVNGGTVTLYNHWTCGVQSVCSDTQCQHPQEGVCTALYPSCRCTIDHLDCHPGDINVAGESTFRLQATNVLSSEVMLVGRIRFDFFEEVREFVNQTCTSVECNQAIYYDPHDTEPSPTQLYRYRLTGVAGKSQLSLYNDFISPETLNPVGGKSCSRVRRCNTAGSLGTCDIIYRGEGRPYATVAPFSGEPCSDGTRKRFHLRADLFEPYIKTLEDGVLQDSTYFEFDPDTNCTTERTAEFYVFNAQSGSYLYVELTTPGSTRQVWMTPGHVSFHTLGEPAEHHGCTTAAGQSSCYFVHACNYESGVYYFQVSPGRHTIRVTQRDFLIKNIAVGQSTNVTIPSDYRQVVVFHVNPVSGRSDNPMNNLEVYFSTGVAMDTWMTRHAFGDTRCSFSRHFGATDEVHIVQSCDVAASDDTWNVHFVRRPTTTCVSTSISVRAKWTENSVIPIAPQAVHTIQPGQVLYIKHTNAGLDDDDVVYARLTSPHHAVLGLRLWKGNHLSQTIDFAPPCLLPSCDSANSPYTQVAWLDSCWHCGSELYNAVFTEVRVIQADPHTLNTEFIDEFVITKWQGMESGVWYNQSFPGPDRRMAFYTAEVTREEAVRIDLEVFSGPGVEVNMYYTNCSIRNRTTPVVMWCFPGHRCTLPLHRLSNFGGFYQTTDVSSPFTDTTIRVVVTGFQTDYQIQYTRGQDTCSEVTEENSPFCHDASLDSSLMSGSDITFPNKDLRAKSLFGNLTIAFSCPLTDGCGCAPLSEDCLLYLREFACETTFGPCSDNGFRKPTSYESCRTVEHHCEKSFKIAGLPEYACEHNYYVEGYGWEDEDGEPIFPINDDIEGDDDLALAPGWIVLIVLLALLLLLLLAAAAYVLMKRGDRIDYSKFSQDDGDGKGYSLM